MSPQKKQPPFPSRSARRRTREAGVTVLEMLVILLVAGLLAGMTVGIFNSMRPKMVVTNSANELSAMLQKARFTAIRQNQQVIGIVETELGGETEDYNPTGIVREWLILKIRDALGNEEEFSSYQMFRGYPPIYFWGPTDSEIHGDGAITFPGDQLTYRFDGSVASTGAFRISYAKQGTRNTLEVAVLTQTGLPTVRKYLKSSDRPSGAAQEFYDNSVASQGGLKRALWVWY